MKYARILHNVSKHILLTPGEVDAFVAVLEERRVNKQEHIVEEGARCQSIYYVEDGILRAYSTDTQGNDHTLMFAIHDWWITDIYAFVQEKPALMNVQAMEESALLELRKSDLDRLYGKVPKFERFFRILMQNAYAREQLRMRENLTVKAEIRYRNFIQKYPLFAERVPLKQIASYLGITPQFLSVIRKRIKETS